MSVHSPLTDERFKGTDRVGENFMGVSIYEDLTLDWTL